MSLTQKQAQAETQNALTAIQTVADAVFIANIDAQIAAAIQKGQYQITALSNVRVNLTTVYMYYTNLGYGVTFPDYLQQNGAQLPSIIQQPVNFFGYNWVQYWQNMFPLYGITNPARMTVSWGQFPLQFLPPTSPV